MKRLARWTIQTLRSAPRAPRRIVGAIRSVEPRRVMHGVAVARAVLAHYWRGLIRLCVVALGFALFAAAEYYLGRGIIRWEWSWFLIMMSAVTVVAAIIAIRATVLMLAIWLVLVPWTWDFPIRSAKYYLSFDLLALTLVFLVVVAKALAQRRTLPRLYTWEWLLFLSVAYINIWPILDTWIARGRFGFTIFGEFWQLLLVPTLVYFIVKATLETRRHITLLLYALVVVGLVWTLSGFYEHFTGYQWHSALTGAKAPLVWRDVGKGRALGASSGQALPGAVLSVGVVALLHLAGFARKTAVRRLCYLAVGSMVAAIFFTYTRVSYGGFAVAMVALFLIGRGRRAQYGLLIAVLGVVALVMAPGLLSKSDFYERMTNPANYYGRMAMSRTALNIIRDHFWFGAGPLSDQTLLARYVSSRAHPVMRGRLYAFPDNDYLVVFAQHGVFGFLFYYGAIFGFVILMFRIRNDLSSDDIPGMNLASTAIAYTAVVFVASVATALRSQPYVYYLLFSMFAMVVRSKQLRDEEKALSQRAAEADRSTPPYERQLVVGGLA